MPMLSGKSGNVSIDGEELAQVTGWRLRTSTQATSYASSSTGGFKRRLPGARQASGSLAFLLDTAVPQTSLHEGEAVELLLKMDAARGVRVPAVIDALDLQIDVASGQIIGGRFQFTSDGAWTWV